MLLDRGIHKLSARPTAPVCDFATLFEHLGAVVPTPLQRACTTLFDDEILAHATGAAGPLLVLLEDAPGSGKTEAGDMVIHRLMAAGRASGFYWGLPTTATADAAYGRKRPLLGRLFAGPCSFMLGHARRDMSGQFRTVETRAELEEGDGEALAWFAQGSRRALLAEAGVGTIDQALMGALRLRHGPVRLLVLQRLGRRRRHIRAADGTPLPEGPDGRPAAPALLLMPPLTAAERAGARGWLAQLLPRAAGLYPDDARLWLGARHLTDPHSIPERCAEGDDLIPERDARPLLESVYGTEVQARTPPALWPRHDRSDGAAVAERQEARRVTLGFRAGLLQDWADGAVAGLGDEDRPPTRLGESYALVLARRQPLGLLGDRLERSTVTVPWRVATPLEDAPACAALAATLPPTARRRLPDMAVVLLEAADSGWHGTVLVDGHAVPVTYDAVRGLEAKMSCILRQSVFRPSRKTL